MTRLSKTLRQGTSCFTASWMELHWKVGRQSTLVSMHEITLMLAPFLPATVNIRWLSSSSLFDGRILSWSRVTSWAVTASVSKL